MGRSSFLPLSRPTASLGVFTFLLIWNAFTWPLVALYSDEMRALPAGLAVFTGDYQDFKGIVMAVGALTSAPVLLVYISFQRQIMRAVMETGFGGR